MEFITANGRRGRGAKEIARVTHTLDSKENLMVPREIGMRIATLNMQTASFRRVIEYFRKSAR